MQASRCCCGRINELGNAGRQQIDARELRPGLWRVRIRWTAGTEEFFRDEAVVIAGPAA